jgi:serine/threonine protein kinase
MIARIKSCQYDFEDEAWATISMGARELIRHLLVLDPDERYSMEEVLRHPWLGGTGPATPLSPRIHQDLARFREQAKQKVR